MRIELHVTTQLDGIGPGLSNDDVAVALNPRPRLSVVEAWAHGHLHGDPATVTFHDSDESGVVGTDRHEVDQAYRSVGRLHVGLEQQGLTAVSARRPQHLTLRSDRPEPVIVGAEQAGEAGVGVEPRQAEPVDASIASDDRCRLGVADDCVLLERKRHDVSVSIDVPRVNRATGSEMPDLRRLADDPDVSHVR